MRCRTGLFGVTILLAFAVLPAVHDAQADMVPHQAIYKMTLSSKSPTARFNGVTGAAVSQIERTCEGWVINEQVIMTMLTVAGGAIEREMTFKARESNDGRTYFFQSDSKTDDIVEKFSGSARRDEDGKAEAEFVTPKPFEMPLPNGTRFYVGMAKWLIDLAVAGKRTGESYAFDGTDDEGPQKVTAFILPDTSSKKSFNGDKNLLDKKAWQIQLAFFKTEGQSSEPQYQLSMRMLENGIITNYQLIFNDLIIDQELQDVLPAKDERCS